MTDAKISTQQQEGGSTSLLADYWVQEELAAELNVSIRTLARWHSLRMGPPRTLLGKSVLYRKDSVRDWLLAQAEAAA